MPLVNNLLTSPHEPEERYPLRVHLCHGCGMSFIDCVVDPEVLYRDYCYRSSMSRTFIRHCQELAEEIDAANKFIVEIASNDGTFLSQVEHSARLGVEPARNLAALAQAQGIPTIPEFFDAVVARQIIADRGPADYVVAMNVFAHVDDASGFIASINQLLKPEGVLIIEVPWVKDAVNNNDSGQIYHEHLSYISIKGIGKFLDTMDMGIDNIKYFPEIHGGSLRFYIKKGKGHKAGLIEDGEIHYDTYQARVDNVRDNLLLYLKNEKIVGIGAAAKGCILCNYCHLENNMIAIYDNTPEKQGKYQPGTHIPILPMAEIAGVKEKILILPHNFKDEIIHNVRKLNPEARFLVAVPELEEI
jgi:SAM-dependent methyltransferase